MMQIEKISLNDIENENKYLLSFPLNSSNCKMLIATFPFTIFVIIDKKNRIVFGFEFIKYFITCGKDEIDVIKIDVVEKEALVYAYNYKQKFFKFNTYEKLYFLQKILKYHTVADIYKLVNLEFSVNDELMKNLTLLLDEEFTKNLINDTINLKSALQLCRWARDDRLSVLELFNRVSFSKNYQLNIIDMIEEIIFKEKNNAKIIFEQLELSKLYDEEKPQRDILEKIFSYRYPLYDKETKLWNSKIKELKLPSNIKITHSPFFEKKDIEMRINIKNLVELQAISEKLQTKSQS